jgi:hypothetical protein
MAKGAQTPAIERRDFERHSGRGELARYDGDENHGLRR